MATDFRLGIKTKGEYLDGARLTYAPVILALSNKEQHDFDFDRVKFREINVDKDSIVAEILTKEATEKKHIKVRGRDKYFNVFAKGAKIIKSMRDGNVDLQKVHNSVLREYSIMFDRDGLHGDGGNNGLLISNDPDYVTNDGHQIPAASGNGFNRVQDVNSVIISLKTQVSELTGSSAIKVFVYGKSLTAFLGTITEDNETSVLDILKRTFPAADFIEVPALVTTATDGDGFVVVSDDMTTLHYTSEPTIKNQGTNEEDEYYYANYAMGSLQVQPDTYGAIIKQPITFAAG